VLLGGHFSAIFPIHLFLLKIPFSILPLLDSNQIVFTLLISPYEVHLPEVIGVGEGQGEKPHLLFWGKIAELFVCFFCPLIGIPWLPLGTVLCPL
jgi:hypothetical protein